MDVRDVSHKDNQTSDNKKEVTAEKKLEGLVNLRALRNGSHG